MKEIKKLISLVMATIMLITSAPVLQASDLANLDMAEINELKQEILPSIMDSDDFKEDGRISEGIPSLRQLKKRYKEALKNYEKRFKEFSESDTKQSIEESIEYIRYKQSEAIISAQTDMTYGGFESEEEQQTVDFYNRLYKDLEKRALSEETRQVELECYCAAIGVGTISVAGICGAAFGLPGLAIGGIAGLFVSSIVTLTSVIGSKHIFGTPGKKLSPIGIKSQFVEKPFESLALLNTRGDNDFKELYKICPDVLYDVIDIEWYVSRNLTIDNMKHRVYPQTTEWKNLTTPERIFYLHDVAERLRAEAQEIKNSQNAN